MSHSAVQENGVCSSDLRALKAAENLYHETAKDSRKGHKIFFNDPVIDPIIVLWPVRKPDISLSTRNAD